MKTQREIKFRAWDKKEKQMREVAMLRWEDGRMSRIAGYWPTTRNNGWKDRDPQEDIYVLMQFTGMVDTKGKEIYEGDIVMQTSPPPYNRKFVRMIVWVHGSYHVSNSKNKAGKSPKLHPIPVWKQKMEVIGNIYENPELIPKPPKALS